MKRETWTICQEREATSYLVIMCGRFTLTSKNCGTREEKVAVRFFGQRFDNWDKQLGEHDTSILRSCSIFLVLSSAAYIIFVIFPHGVTQAFLKSKKLLPCEKDIRFNPEDEPDLVITKEEALYQDKPLHGLYNASDYWVYKKQVSVILLRSWINQGQLVEFLALYQASYWF